MPRNVIVTCVMYGKTLEMDTYCTCILVSIMGERERTQEYGNEIHCHVYTFSKFQENTTILSYIHVQYTIDTMQKKRASGC